MKRRVNIYYLIIFILFLQLFLPTSFFSYSLNAATIRCSVCRKKISGRFVKNQKGRVFCSKSCFNKSLPKCCICKRPATIVSNKKNFCSKKCVRSTWPICVSCKRRSNGGIRRGTEKLFLCSRCARKPKCFSCSMPADYGTFSDGRAICKSCHKSSIKNLDRAIEIAEDVRSLMKSKLNIFTNHNIRYKLVSLQELESMSNKKSKGLEFGLYNFEQVIEKITTAKRIGSKRINEVVERVKSESHTIYFLHGTPENQIREIAAHELTHDWMQEHYPLVKEIKIKEGCSEYVASLVNSLYGRSKMNKRMALNKDPIYGGGYRKIKKIADRYGWNGVLKLLKKY